MKIKAIFTNINFKSHKCTDQYTNMHIPTQAEKQAHTHTHNARTHNTDVIDKHVSLMLAFSHLLQAPSERYDVDRISFLSPFVCHPPVISK